MRRFMDQDNRVDRDDEISREVRGIFKLHEQSVNTVLILRA